jgi:hypothetical protein
MNNYSFMMKIVSSSIVMNNIIRSFKSKVKGKG